MAVEKSRISLLVVIILVILLAGLGFILIKSQNGPQIQPSSENQQKNPKEPVTACVEDGGLVKVGAVALCCNKESGVKPSVQLVDGNCVASQEDTVGTCVAGWSKMCGNGICDKDNGENQCNCARDCNADGTDRCAQEGETLGIGPITNFNAGACCEGLVKIKALLSSGGNCDNANDTANSTQVCTKCGDGVCGIGENKCNCPQDCDGSDKCVGEGGYLGEASGVFKCCQGLTELDAAKNTNLGSPDACTGSYATCAKCGDGICGAGENQCNCPKDCPKTTDDFQSICPPKAGLLFNGSSEVVITAGQKSDCEKSGGKTACSGDSCKCLCP